VVLRAVVSSTAPARAAGGGAAPASQREPQFEQQAYSPPGRGWLAERGAGNLRPARAPRRAAPAAACAPPPAHFRWFAAQQVQRDPPGVGAVAFEQAGRLGVGQGPLARWDGPVDRARTIGWANPSTDPGASTSAARRSSASRAADVLACERGGVPDAPGR
jgi:hypothetical protein